MGHVLRATSDGSGPRSAGNAWVVLALVAIVGVSILTHAMNLGLTKKPDVHYELELSLSFFWVVWHGVVFGTVAFLLPSGAEFAAEDGGRAEVRRRCRHARIAGAVLVVCLGLYLFVAREISSAVGGGRLLLSVDTMLLTTLTSSLQLFALTALYEVLVYRVKKHATVTMLVALLVGLLLWAAPAPLAASLLLHSPSPYYAMPPLALVELLANATSRSAMNGPALLWGLLAATAFLALRVERRA